MESYRKKMRIISGLFKGKLINYLKNDKTRPLKDSVKENIFNVIHHSNLIDIRIENSNILDLYSGIGSFGIECISRGAEKVTFIEKDEKAVKILKENLHNLSIIKQTKIFDNDIDFILKNKIIEKYNIFFLYLSFSDFNFIQNLKLIKKNNYFETNHLIIIHKEKRCEDNFQECLKIINIKEYGRSKIIFGKFS